jgi:hypothetical protein
MFDVERFWDDLGILKAASLVNPWGTKNEKETAALNRIIQVFEDLDFQEALRKGGRDVGIELNTAWERRKIKGNKTFEFDFKSRLVSILAGDLGTIQNIDAVYTQIKAEKTELIRYFQALEYIAEGITQNNLETLIVGLQLLNITLANDKLFFELLNYHGHFLTGWIYYLDEPCLLEKCRLKKPVKAFLFSEKLPNDGPWNGKWDCIRLPEKAKLLTRHGYSLMDEITERFQSKSKIDTKNMAVLECENPFYEILSERIHPGSPKRQSTWDNARKYLRLEERGLLGENRKPEAPPESEQEPGILSFDLFEGDVQKIKDHAMRFKDLNERLAYINYCSDTFYNRFMTKNPDAFAQQVWQDLAPFRSACESLAFQAGTLNQGMPGNDAKQAPGEAAPNGAGEMALLKPNGKFIPIADFDIFGDDVVYQSPSGHGEEGVLVVQGAVNGVICRESKDSLDFLKKQFRSPASWMTSDDNGGMGRALGVISRWKDSGNRLRPGMVSFLKCYQFSCIEGKYIGDANDLLKEDTPGREKEPPNPPLTGEIFPKISKWDELTISVISDEELFFKNKTSSRRVQPSDLGMAPKKGKIQTQTQEWRMLFFCIAAGLDIGRARPFIDSHGIENRSLEKTIRSKINKKFRGIFKQEKPPFPANRKPLIKIEKLEPELVSNLDLKEKTMYRKGTTPEKMTDEEHLSSLNSDVAEKDPSEDWDNAIDEGKSLTDEI